MKNYIHKRVLNFLSNRNFEDITTMIKDSYGIHRIAVENEDADWQRVNSYVADIVKDIMLTYSKLARLRSDFVGSELAKIGGVSNKVREVGEIMLAFSKAFNANEYSIAKKEHGEKDSEDYSEGGGPPVEDFSASFGERPTEEKKEPPVEDFGAAEEKGPPVEDFEVEEEEKPKKSKKIKNN